MEKDGEAVRVRKDLEKFALRCGYIRSAAYKVAEKYESSYFIGRGFRFSSTDIHAQAVGIWH